MWLDSGTADAERPRWAERPPLAFIQQVVVKAAVHPYTEGLIMADGQFSNAGRVFSTLL